MKWFEEIIIQSKRREIEDATLRCHCFRKEVTAQDLNVVYVNVVLTEPEVWFA